MLTFLCPDVKQPLFRNIAVNTIVEPQCYKHHCWAISLTEPVGVYISQDQGKWFHQQTTSWLSLKDEIRWNFLLNFQNVNFSGEDLIFLQNIDGVKSPQLREEPADDMKLGFDHSCNASQTTNRDLKYRRTWLINYHTMDVPWQNHLCIEINLKGFFYKCQVRNFE